MSKKFNINDYPGKYVMHCKTEEEAKDFCRVLHEAGRKWCNSDSYLTCTEFKRYKSNTCYYFNANEFSTYEYYNNAGYTILEWSDFMNKEFTRDSIKVGDMLKNRDGSIELVMSTYDGIIVAKISTTYTRAINSGLTHMLGDTDRDVVAIRRPVDIYDISFDAFEKNLGRLVYEREETVEMTLEEVCKALGKNVKIVKE